MNLDLSVPYASFPLKRAKAGIQSPKVRRLH